METLSDVLDRHKDVFSKGLSTNKGFNAEINLQDGARPVFCKARSAPSALRQKAEEELDRLESHQVVVQNAVSGLLQLTVWPRKMGVHIARQRRCICHTGKWNCVQLD